MITRSFSFRVLTSLLFLAFSFVALVPFAQAALPPAPPCHRYGYIEKYDVDTNTLPPNVTVRKDVTVLKQPSRDGIHVLYFLENSGSKPLVVQYKDPYKTQIKLVDGKAYNKDSGIIVWLERTGAHMYQPGSNSLDSLVRIDGKMTDDWAFSSDTKPAPSASVRFSIAAQHDGQPVNITGTLSYTLLEYDCSTGKVVIVDTVVTTPATPAMPSTAVLFVQNLSFRMRSVAVSNLQQFLVSQGLLTADLVTGYFGPKTLAAVKAFQRQQSITPVSGFFGPLTRTKANSTASGSSY